jgi:hypothetical protein
MTDHPSSEPVDLLVRARAVAHSLNPRCTGGTGHGLGGDTARYHSSACDKATETIAAALAEEADDWRDTMSVISSYLGAGMGDDKSTAEQLRQRIMWGIEEIEKRAVGKEPAGNEKAP